MDATAVATAVGALFTGIGAMGTFGTVIYGAMQARVAAKAISGQTFTTLITLAGVSEYNRRIGIVAEHEAAALSGNPDVVSVVDFLNTMGNFIDQGLISSKSAVVWFWPGIVDCRRKLIGPNEWLATQRAERRNIQLYNHFESLCRPENEANLLTNRQIQWEREYANGPLQQWREHDEQLRRGTEAP